MRTTTIYLIALVSIFALIAGCDTDQSDQLAVPNGTEVEKDKIDPWSLLTPEFLDELRDSIDTATWIEHTFVIPRTGGIATWSPWGEYDRLFTVSIEDTVACPIRNLTLTVRILDTEAGLLPGTCVAYEFDGNMLDYVPLENIQLASHPDLDGQTFWTYYLLPSPSYVYQGGFVPLMRHDNQGATPRIFSLNQDGSLDPPVQPPVPPLVLINDREKPGDEE